jgi:glycosyltransferase involved in cell wall biosynthesis
MESPQVTSPAVQVDSQVRVSVIVPTKNRPAPLRSALLSVVDQRLGDEIEAIVVNDGGESIDDVVDDLSDTLRTSVVDLMTCQGPGYARNVAIDNARGRYLAFLDDDDLFLRDHLDVALGVLENTAFDLVYTGAIVSDTRLAVDDYERRGGMFPRKFYSFDDRMLLVANYIHTGSVVTRNFRSSAVRFDETLTHCEDWDLWLALRHVLNYEFAHVDQMTTVYHQVASDWGLVHQAEAAVPSPFTRIREKLYGRWTTDDKLVHLCRHWFAEFDRRSNVLAVAGLPVPRKAYEDALKVIHLSFQTSTQPTVAQLDQIFEHQ